MSEHLEQTKSALAAITKGLSDRTKWPLLVLCCRKPTLPFGGFCNTHPDCRAEHWRRVDAEAANALLRGTPVRPKSRRRPVAGVPVDSTKEK